MNLIEAILSNKASAINASLKITYDSYYPKIKSFVIKNMGTDDEARDVFQDGLMTIYDHVRSRRFKGNSSLETYLFSICRNIWLQRLKKLKKSDDFSEELKLIDESQANLINIRKLDEVMSELKADCQKILVAFYYKGKNIGQLKELMGMNSDQAVKNKKGRCLGYLLNIIKKKKLSKASFFNEKSV